MYEYVCMYVQTRQATRCKTFNGFDTRVVAVGTMVFFLKTMKKVFISRRHLQIIDL
jgi:hypothetical protein